MGRDVRGTLNPFAVLSEVQVVTIRGLLARGYSTYAVARMMGCSQSTVSRIGSGKIWRHLTSDTEVSLHLAG